MNLKERIEIINQLKSTGSSKNIEIKREVDAVDIFVKNNAVRQLIMNSISRDKNIILLCPSYCDKTILANYIRSYIDSSVPVDIIGNISENIAFVNAQKVIVPEPSLSEVLKIFELILCDYRTFIFCLNIKTFDNILESFRTLLALSNPNLSANNIEHMLGVSASVLVYVDRNEDGLYEVTNVGKIVYKNNKAFLDVLYSQVTDSEQEETPVYVEPMRQIETEDVSISLEDEKNEKVIEVLPEQNIENDKVEDIEPVQEEISVEQPKINKYKLLKEKFKNKKQLQE